MQTNSPSVAIVFPALNEAENLSWVLEEAYQVLCELTGLFWLIVIDDASTDTTPQLLETLKKRYPSLMVYRNAVIRGCHPSSLVGFEISDADYTLFLPADGQIPAGEVSTFLAAALEGADVIYSWRKNRADSLLRRFISGCYNRLVRVLFGIPVHDADSAAMLSRKAILKILPQMRSDSAFITVELLLAAKREKLSISEVIISHRPRVCGVAKGLNLKDVLKVPVSILGMVWWMLSRRIFNRPYPENT